MKHEIMEQMQYPFEAWTDYPLYPKEERKTAPIRKIMVMSYDGNKYCVIKYKTKKQEIKSGYIYPYPTNSDEYNGRIKD